MKEWCVNGDLGNYWFEELVRASTLDAAKDKAEDLIVRPLESSLPHCLQIRRVSGIKDKLVSVGSIAAYGEPAGLSVNWDDSPTKNKVWKRSLSNLGILRHHLDRPKESFMLYDFSYEYQTEDDTVTGTIQTSSLEEALELIADKFQDQSGLEITVHPHAEHICKWTCNIVID